MARCYICETDQRQVDIVNLSVNKDEIKWNVPIYNIDLHTYIKGKSICDQCMDVYYKIHALETGRDFVVAGVEYFGDGRNLK